MNPQIARRKFYIGGAAIFWFVVALLIWSSFFFSQGGAFPGAIRGRWFFSLYFSSPAVVVALLAVLIRNMTPRFDPAWLPAWLATPLVFVAVGYVMLAWISQFMLGH
jgi:hypothetical protein